MRPFVAVSYGILARKLWRVCSEAFYCGDMWRWWGQNVTSEWNILVNPICSMYGIFTNICPKNHPNVRKYTIHGAYGNDGMQCGSLFFGVMFSSVPHMGNMGILRLKLTHYFGRYHGISLIATYNVIEPTACGLCWEVGNFIQICHLQMG